MVQLRDSLDELSEAKIQIVGISYDSVDTLKKFSDSEKIPFPLLSDEGSQAIEAFDLIFENGLPHPGTVLIDQGGTIRKKIFKEGYRTRHTIEELKKAAQELPASNG
ncbi:MAG: peroxiredoxin family protein [bacterium]|nr:peroxiredoxin family protein [bacterium]